MAGMHFALAAATPPAHKHSPSKLPGVGSSRRKSAGGHRAGRRAREKQVVKVDGIFPSTELPQPNLLPLPMPCPTTSGFFSI